ncbi:MAG: substrate-binding domain-containing protein [Planctomycetota bacterium]|jgi:ribose transport system substrate-binding protein
MKKVPGYLVITIAMASLLFCGCGRREEENKEGPVIALILKTLNNPFFIEMEKGAKEAVGNLPINLIVQSGEREMDVEKQMQIVENMIQRGVDAICLVPTGSKEIIPAIVKANQANIPVLILDNKVNEEALAQAGGHIASYIGSDNIEGGRIAGRYLAEKLNGQGKVAVLEGIPGQEAGDQRLSGFLEAVKKSPDIEIVASQTANWEMDQGFNVFQNILQSHPEVEALFSCSDNMALGAIEAIAAAGRTGEVMVVGFDAIAEARDAIRKGTMEGSLAQYPAEIGRLGVEYAYQFLNGEEIPAYVPTKIELITKEKLVESE